MRTTRRLRLLVITFACVALSAIALADEGDLKEELGDDVEPTWIYDDVEAGYAKAKETGKPLLVAFR